MAGQGRCRGGGRRQAAGRLMFGQDRDSLRRAYAEAWRRHCEGLPLDLQQQRIADVLALHPEYQAFVLSPDALAQEFDGSDGRTNPYLHMGLHLAVREQLATRLPPEAVQARAPPPPRPRARGRGRRRRGAPP
ncbi:MAG TPA: hypothetical protein DIT63_02400, partial [Gammaproteobacteria bacterium]|nr:hypothetical protein [Gammaproteobacteria bacterium]